MEIAYFQMLVRLFTDQFGTFDSATKVNEFPFSVH